MWSFSISICWLSNENYILHESLRSAARQLPNSFRLSFASPRPVDFVTWDCFTSPIQLSPGSNRTPSVPETVSSATTTHSASKGTGSAILSTTALTSLTRRAARVSALLPSMRTALHVHVRCFRACMRVIEVVLCWDWIVCRSWFRLVLEVLRFFNRLWEHGFRASEFWRSGLKRRRRRRRLPRRRRRRRRRWGWGWWRRCGGVFWTWFSMHFRRWVRVKCSGVQWVSRLHGFIRRTQLYNRLSIF